MLFEEILLLLRLRWMVVAGSRAHTDGFAVPRPASLRRSPNRCRCRGHSSVADQAAMEVWKLCGCDRSSERAGKSGRGWRTPRRRSGTFWVLTGALPRRRLRASADDTALPRNFRPGARHVRIDFDLVGARHSGIFRSSSWTVSWHPVVAHGGSPPASMRRSGARRAAGEPCTAEN